MFRPAYHWIATLGALLSALLTVSPSFASSSGTTVPGAWETLAPLPINTGDNGAAVGSDGRIYVYGGEACTSSHDFVHGCPYVTTVEAYTPTTNTWATVAPLPNPRGGRTGRSHLCLRRHPQRPPGI